VTTGPTLHAASPSGLEYPFAAPPARGHLMEVAPGVHWIRMPLPYALDHINLWALEDEAGWTVVDTGVHTDESIGVWTELLAHWPDNRPITRVIVTHMHPDHVGLAGWLTRKFGCRLWMTRLEYLNCRVIVSDTGREAPQDGLNFFRRAGWSEAALDTYRARFGRFGKHVYALPDSYRRLHDGEALSIGGRRWRVVVGSGHSPEHACLYCPELDVLISGDQVLPRISSNVSTHAMEPDSEPMSEWLHSLDKLRRDIPDGVLVLPSHNECFRGLHARIDALRESQERAFNRLRRSLDRPRRAVDVFAHLFSRDVAETEGPKFSMATGEALASLNHLASRGELDSETDAAGAVWYRLRHSIPNLS
jgi:glyoxylase-like metal-dependent hydrolase (beta-lactamase superfamily II)